MNRNYVLGLASVFSVFAAISQNINSVGSGLVAAALWAGYFFGHWAEDA
jgi:hypothetical protein